MKKVKGFTYWEIIIVLTVICVLGAAAIPAYFDYKRRVYFSNILQVTKPYVSAVNECYKKNKDLKKCSGSQNSIPANLLPNEDVAGLTTVNGVIEVAPLSQYGILTTDNYKLIPKPDPKTNNLVWTTDGNAVTKKYFQDVD